MKNIKLIALLVCLTVIVCSFVGCAKTAALTFEANGGEVVGEAPLEYTTKAALALPTATLQYYNFKGWSLNSDGSGTVYTELPAELELTDEQVENGMKLYAVWERKTGKITYAYDGGSLASGATAPESYKYGEIVVLPAVEKEHFEFLGWTIDGNIVETIDKTQEGDVTVTATWLQVETVINYVLGLEGATLADASNTFATEDGIEDLLDEEFIPTADGYVFAGWYTDAEFTTAITEIPAETTEEVTIYAKWMATPTVEGDNWVGVK